MKERKFHELIEKQNAEEKEVVRQRLQTELELCKTDERKSFFVRNKRWLFALAACFVCLAIVVPVSLKYVALNKDIEGGEDQPRYCTSDDYKIESFGMSLKEYSQSLEQPFLYLDWYDFGDVSGRNSYVDKLNKEILCVSEKIFNLNTGDDVLIYIMKKDIIMDFVESYVQAMNNEEYVSDIKVLWRISNIEGYAYFEYENYNYCLYFLYPMSEQTIFDVVQQMLETAVAA